MMHEYKERNSLLTVLPAQTNDPAVLVAESPHGTQDSADVTPICTLNVFSGQSWKVHPSYVRRDLLIIDMCTHA